MGPVEEEVVIAELWTSSMVSGRGMERRSGMLAGVHTACRRTYLWINVLGLDNLDLILD